MKKATLRKYQNEQFVACIDTNQRDTLVHSPTGSGKTLVAVAVACRVASAEKYSVIITTPQSDVEESFVRAVSRGVITKIGVVSHKIVVSRARDDVSSYRAIVDHIENGHGKILLTTHAAMVSASSRDPELFEKLNGEHMLIVDEFHHATSTDSFDNEGTRIGRIVKQFRDRGSKVVGFTATPFRADSLEVVTAKTTVLFRSWVDHMNEGFCPRNVDVSAVSFTGREIECVADKMVEAWKRHDRAKIIIRVPHVPSEACDNISGIKRRFEQEGARVLNVSGSKCTDIKRIKTAMAHEESCTYEDSQFDVIIGCNRVREAFNWPHCCAVYCLGCPGSATLAVQLLGRGMRKRCISCPTSWTDRAAIVFFVLTEAKSNVEDVNRTHAAKTALMCCFLRSVMNQHVFNELNTRLKLEQHSPGKKRSAIEIVSDRMMIGQLLSDVATAVIEGGSNLTRQKLEMTVKQAAKRLHVPEKTATAVLESIYHHEKTAEIAEEIDAVKGTFSSDVSEFMLSQKLLKAIRRNNREVHECLIVLNASSIDILGDKANDLIKSLASYSKDEFLSAAWLVRRRRTVVA